jgi:hypothetical protein
MRVRLGVAESLPIGKGADRLLHKNVSMNAVVRGRGRPATGHRPRLALRASEELHLAIQQWAERQIDAPNQSEAVRRLLIIALTAERRREKAERHKDAAAKVTATDVNGASHRPRDKRAAEARGDPRDRSLRTLPDGAE